MRMRYAFRYDLSREISNRIRIFFKFFILEKNYFEEEFFKLRTVQFSNLRIFLYVKFFHSGKNYLKKYISNRGIF